MEDIVSLTPKILKYQDKPNFRLYLAIACFDTGRIGDARKHVDHALRAEPENSDYLLASAAIELRRGGGESALRSARQSLDTAVGLAGADAEPLRSQILDLRAILEALSGNRDAALAALGGMKEDVVGKERIDTLRRMIEGN